MNKLSDTNAKHNKRKILRACAWLALMLLCAGIVLSLSGCATQSTIAPVPYACPTPPQLPKPRQPIPQETYSESVQRLLLTWQERLTGMSPMSK